MTIADVSNHWRRPRILATGTTIGELKALIAHYRPRDAVIRIRSAGDGLMFPSVEQVLEMVRYLNDDDRLDSQVDIISNALWIGTCPII